MQEDRSRSQSSAVERVAISPPAISLPKGGGAIRGMGEKLAANPVTGSASLTTPIYTSPGRAGFGPQLSLSYDSGSGNGAFGFGWSLSLPSVTRKTDKGLPKYMDSVESDTFILSGAEDLVPYLEESAGQWKRRESKRVINGQTYRIQAYRPRIEGLFARIERWSNEANLSDTFWRSISRDNVTTWYGKTSSSRIADPADPACVFSWLICESYDDKGNAIVYEYEPENSDRVALLQTHERNRTEITRSAARYIRHIKYGNRVPFYPILASDQAFPQPVAQWMFDVVFDYGDHDLENPAPEKSLKWPVRQDPFSTYRAGFEIRTYRLCRRALMFHNFDELGETPCLIRSTDFTYSFESDSEGSEQPVFSFLTSTTQSGYRRQADGAYLRRSMPALEFQYSEPIIDETVREAPAESLKNLPYGLDGSRYQWIDLDGEGAPGILTEQGAGWFYKRNLSPAPGVAERAVSFGAAELVAKKPSPPIIGRSRSQFIDLAGDGQLDLVNLERLTPGFFERANSEDWESFVAFEQAPNLDWRSPDLRLVDLTGDGHADILITEGERFLWLPSLAEAGFGPAVIVSVAADEEKGPSIVFADPDQSIFLADISGDGLNDLVRIRNGEVCYWPNLGYGKFGTRVTMDEAPWFDAPDQFDPKRIRLADIDGSGVVDIIYIGANGIDLYFNQSGNSWSKARRLTAVPAVDNLSSVQVADLFGNGTACLVWSSPLPGAAGRQMRYIDLMSGQKPRLLIKSVNNLGAETKIHYAPSTRFYLADELAGTPWITRLPFPVQVVERVETCDRISGNRFVTRYAYHHGYFDGIEREFRGFGMVEQWDTEEFSALSESGAFPAAANIDQTSQAPPVLTRSWFHTGVYLDRNRVSNFFAGLLDDLDAGAYYREPGLTDAQARALLLEDTVLPSDLTPEEEREACRALKGEMLRQEVYALDGSEKERHPYIVTERNFTIRRLQPLANNRHTVFFTHTRESLSYYYERNPRDPRVTHALTIEVDDFGDILKSAEICYGRRQPDPDLSPEDQAKQAEVHVVWTENGFTNRIDLDDARRRPLPSESRAYELTGLRFADDRNRFAMDEILSAGSTALSLAYEQTPSGGLPQKRLIEHALSLYRRNDLTGPLPPGRLESLALLYESYKLAFTAGLAPQVYAGRATESMLADDCGYARFEGDADWWIPSGRLFFSADPSLTPELELDDARRRFFLPKRFSDPFDEDVVIGYDIYDLLMTETIDALGNRTQAVNDYRVLRPRLISDPNGNRSEVAFDTLGMVVGAGVMGKPEPADSQGDSLLGFVADLDEATVLSHLQDPLSNPHAILQRAGSRLVYDLFAYQRTRNDPQPQPATVYALMRETHEVDLEPGAQTKIQHSFSYTDGFGREIEKKTQAEPGPLAPGGSSANPRWVGSGWTVFNNKGKPVRKYEPYFTGTHIFELARSVGVSSVIFYDPVERVVGELRPNHTWEKTIFDAWRQETWDVNDTISTTDPKTDPQLGDYFRRLPEAEYLPDWYSQRANGEMGPEEQAAAIKAAVHAETPAIAFADSLGRLFLTVTHNRFERNGAIFDEKYGSHVEFDIEGNQRAAIDALGRIVMRYDYNLLGALIHSSSLEAGERWALDDVAGKPAYVWDGRDHRLRTSYDALRRPIQVYMREGDEPELLVGKTVYGEGVTNAEANNLRGKPYQSFDGAGIVTTGEYDFKGNLLSSSRRLAVDYKATLDWSGAVALEAEVFMASSSFDALNRPVAMTTPDNSVIHPHYNEANLLERVDVSLRGSTTSGVFVSNIDYNAKGQRELIEYGNRTSTTFDYDPLTFRMIHLRTLKDSDLLQDLFYTYDPAGNITRIQDDAQQTIYFRNRQVEPSNDYKYDSLYRLIEATGREHLGQIGGQPNPPTAPDAFNQFHTGLDHPGDGNAMGTYLESYFYDAVGNILNMRHRGSDPAHPGWTRAYNYDEASLIDPGKTNNRLSSTQIGSGPVERYTYDAHGNMTGMPHLSLMRWNYLDRLEATAQQVVNSGSPETTHYVYDAGGQRARKVTERQAAEGATPARMKERIYLGGFEIYREYDAGGVALERETLHVMDGKQRIALVETRTQGDDGSPAQLLRYQLGNHLGSASLELDEIGRIISYEEYYPYGNASYQAMDASIKAAAKRYRYTGKERDEETGLNYHGARYYACWLGRWTSCDPAGLIDGLNSYSSVRDNPSNKTDSTGNWTDQLPLPPKTGPVPGPNRPPDFFPEIPPEPIPPGLPPEPIPLRPPPVLPINPLILPLIFLQPDNQPTASSKNASRPQEGVDPEPDHEPETEVDTDTDSEEVLTETETDTEPEDLNLHHIATDKSSRWTPRFKPIFDNAGMDFDEPSNLVEVEGHRGPHPDEYHQIVYDRLKNAIAPFKPGSDEYADAVVTALALMEIELQTPGTQLNTLVRNPDPRAVERMIRAREEREMRELLEDAFDPFEPGEAYIPDDDWSLPWCKIPNSD